MSLSIVIPSCSRPNLRICLSRIFERDTIKPAQVIIVDDGAGDIGRALGTRVIPGKRPFVIARNLNMGIRAAGTDDVICMNDDALLKTRGGLTTMVTDALQARVGLCSAAMTGRAHPIQQPRQSSGIRIVPAPLRLNFSCMFVPRATIDRIGLLDEDFIGYGFDDDDYCLRVREAGMNLAVHDHCHVDHTGKHAPPVWDKLADFETKQALAGEIFRRKWPKA